MVNFGAEVYSLGYCCHCTQGLIDNLDCIHNSDDLDTVCAKCRAEEEHDFDADPGAMFNRGGMRIIEAWTDYPFENLGDESGKEAPVRGCVVLDYDGDKYCDIQIKGDLNYYQIKAGYLYTKPGRSGEVPCVPISELEKLG